MKPSEGSRSVLEICPGAMPLATKDAAVKARSSLMVLSRCAISSGERSLSDLAFSMELLSPALLVASAMFQFSLCLNSASYKGRACGSCET